jgi:hypothetical protein
VNFDQEERAIGKKREGSGMKAFRLESESEKKEKKNKKDFSRC